jgi:hypothetical protein
VLELPHEGARVLELGAALGAAPDVRFEGRRPEAHLTIEEQIDFFR